MKKAFKDWFEERTGSYVDCADIIVEEAFYEGWKARKLAEYKLIYGVE